MTGGYITDFFDFWKKLVDKNWTYSFWGVYHGLLGGISRTFGGYITDFWGVYHGLF